MIAREGIAFERFKKNPPGVAIARNMILFADLAVLQPRAKKRTKRVLESVGVDFLRRPPDNLQQPQSSHPAEMLRHREDVLVAAAGEIDHHKMIFGLLRRELHHLRHRMR